MEKELQELKAKFGTVYTITVPVGDDDKQSTFYLKKIDRIVFSAAMKLMETDELDAAEFMIKSLWVGGVAASIIIEDFDALRSAAKLLVTILKSKEGSIKKN